MASCPNKSLKEWKDLVSNVGEDVAYDLWDRYQGEVPAEAYTANVSQRPTLLSMIESTAEQMGINIVELSEYAEAHPDIDVSGVSGVADLTRKTIAVAEKRPETLTEEIVHMATAIMEQTNPRMVTNLISKIGRFKFYKDVFNAYKNNPEYQTPDGRPDIRKIKKEAADKLIAEIIINDSQDTDTYPELMEQETRNLFTRLWENVLDIIRGLYAKSDFDIFQDAASQIASGNVGSADVISSQGVFFQQIPKNSAVDRLFDTVKDFSSKLTLYDETDDTPRHYMMRLPDGTEQKIAMSVTEKVKKGKRPMAERVGLDKIQDDDKAKWGDESHRLLEQHISTNLIDKNGYALATPGQIVIQTELEDEVAHRVKEFAKELIGSYPPGTRFLVEPKVVNTKAKGMIASAIDFMAIIPEKNKAGEDSFKLDMLDWKFTSINQDKDSDIPWYKQKDWKSQMGEYKKIMMQYGTRHEQFGKTRMIPFLMNYEDVMPGKPIEGIYPSSLEIGKIDSIQETNIYLLPVPVRTESTGIESVDRLIRALNSHYDKQYAWQGHLTPGERKAKVTALNQLSEAIRRLQVSLSFEPIVNVGKNFIRNSVKIFDDFKNIDYSKVDSQVLDKMLGDLIALEESAKKFTDIDQVFLDTYPKKGLTKKQAQTLKELENISTQADRMTSMIAAVRAEYAVQLGVRKGWTTEKTKENILNPEKEISNLSRTFLEGSKLKNFMIKAVTNTILRAKSTIDVKLGKEMRRFSQILVPLERAAQAQGKKAFDLIGTVADGKLKLISKLDPQFLEKLREARGNRDKTFILNNLNKDAHNKAIAKIMAEQEKALKEHIWSIDPTENDEMMEKAIFSMKNSLDITRKGFYGWNNPEFTNTLYQNLDESKNLSKEYQDMAQNQYALQAWEFFQEWNNKAKDMGYLPKYEDSFFPLIEASALQKFNNSTQGVVGEVKDFFRDQFHGRVEERPGFSRIDPETGKLRKGIPKYYTQTNKSVEQLSTDMAEVATKWVASLLEYESSRELENELLTLYEVEKNKGKIVTDEQGNIVTIGGKVQTTTENNKNLGVLGALIDDALYHLSEDPFGIGQGTLSKLARKTSKSDDEGDLAQREISAKKTFEFFNSWLRNLAVGLKYGITLANTAGQLMQSYIMKGNHYRYREYSGNNLRVISGRLSTEQRGLLDLFVPLSEDSIKEQRRRLAKGYSYKSFLNTWSFSDVMQVSNSFPERLLQMTNALSFLENTMVVDGALVNIREYVKAQDRQNRAGLTLEERQNLKKSFQTRVDALKEDKSLLKNVKITDQGTEIVGVTDEEIAKYRVKIMDYARNLNGQMDENDKAAYRRSTIMRSFMMFKTWIPKLVSVRALDIQFNQQQEGWEFGRVRVFFETWRKLGMWNVHRMRDIIQGNENGIKIMDELLKEKREAYERKHGTPLEITEEEFQDLIQEELARQVRELRLAFSLMGMLIYSMASRPPEDATALERNQYKYFAKIIHKITDELLFYYNPVSFQGVTKGNILPALNLMVSASRVIREIGEAVYGNLTSDQKMIDNAHITKYFLNLIPVGYQFQTDLLPLLDAELAKEMGIVVTAEARRN